jgi:MerR family transcriptional regulator, mercuric resistance operon regulatory protein
MSEQHKGLFIGELASKAGVKPDTVRFYEKGKLLPPPTRTATGYRVYDEAALRQLRFIRQAQALGFSLQQIRRILQLRGAGPATCRCVLSIAETTLSETKAKLDELQRFHDALEQNVRKWRTAAKSGRKMASEFCALIESTGITDGSLK